MRENKNKILSFLTAFSIILSPVATIRAQASDPTIELPNIYEIADAGIEIDTDSDNAGNVYVVFERSGNIYLVKNRGSEQLVGAGSNPTIAIDNSGSPHIAYINTGSVIYETFDGDWDNDVNVGIGSNASYVDIDTDSNGKAHIFMRAKYYPDNYSWVDLLYVTNTNGPFEIVRGWNGDRDYSSSGSWGGYYYDSHPISIAIDNNNNYHLLFWHASVWVWYADRDWSYSLQYHTNIDGASVNLGSNHTLYKNSLAIDALGRANILYDGIKHGLAANGTWAETSLTTASNPSITSNSSAIAIAYASSGINYYENNGVGMGQTILIDSQGDNPAVVLSNSNRFVYYIKNGKIYLATDKIIFNAPVITGVEDGEIYNTDKEVSWDHGSGSLNGVPVSSPLVVSEEGNYNLTVTNSEDKSTSVNFSIDKTAPIITIDGYNTLPTNQDITVTASTSEGTLNASSHTFSENGSFEFIATDSAGNVSQETVVISNIDKVAPAIKIDIYNTSPTNQDITVTASASEGTMNATSHTFTDNGSFEFIATDSAGNSSSYTVTITNIDKVSPTITIDPFSESWTNQDITVTSSTNEGTMNATSHTFTENGSFEFVATDSAGNQTSKIVSVTNIDKSKPSNTSITNPVDGNHVRQTIQLNATTEDNQSGIEKVEFYSSSLGKIGEYTNSPFKMDLDTTLVSDGEQIIWVTAYDKAGNKIDSPNISVFVDNTNPVISIGDYQLKPTNQDIIVTASTNEGTLNTNSHTFSENGSFTFIATDNAGNVSQETVVISNIDKDGPQITIDEYNTLPTNQDVTVTASTSEGTLNATSHTFTENGSFEFVATDDIGNQTKRLIQIDNIDKTPPSGSINSISSDKPLRSIVSLTTDINDNGSGIDRVEFYHASTVTLIGTAYLAPFSTTWDTTGVSDGLHKVWSISYDKAGNQTISQQIDVSVDNTAPIITIEPYSTQSTTSSITVNATTNEGTLNATSCTFMQNGSFEFVATDKAGNTTKKTVTISNIILASTDSNDSISTLVPSANTTSVIIDQDENIESSQLAIVESDDTTSNEKSEEQKSTISESSDDTQSAVKGEEDSSQPKGIKWYWYVALGIIATGLGIFLARRGQPKNDSKTKNQR